MKTLSTKLDILLLPNYKEVCFKYPELCICPLGARETILEAHKNKITELREKYPYAMLQTIVIKKLNDYIIGAQKEIEDLKERYQKSIELNEPYPEREWMVDRIESIKVNIDIAKKDGQKVKATRDDLSWLQPSDLIKINKVGFVKFYKDNYIYG